MSLISKVLERIQPIRAVLLINFIPPYHLPTFKYLAESLEEFKVLVSTFMEPNREWEVDWKGLKVRKQRNITLRRFWSHPQGFSDIIYVQLPYATIFELYKEKPDVIISTEMGMRSFLALAYRFFFRTTKVILWLPLSEHTEHGRGWLRALIRRIIIGQADGIFVNGESGARYVKEFGITENRVYRVPYPTDNTCFQKADVTRNRDAAYRLLYVGHLIQRKGILPFVQVLTTWVEHHPERIVEFTIVGSGELYSELDQLQLPANLKISLVGNINYADLQEYYNHAGILVFPTLADEWGIVVNEALYSGLLVLGSIYSQAVEELVIEGETGWIFNPNDIEDTYREIDNMMNTPIDTLEVMRTRGLERALACTPEKIAMKMLAVIYSTTQGTPD